MKFTPAKFPRGKQLTPVSPMRNAGFTLLEVLVATSITVLIGVGAVQLLSSIGNAGRASEQSADELAGLQRFNQIISRDLEQIIGREIRDEFGDPQPSLVVGGDYIVEFTRSGWRNSPVAENLRSTLQRVAYQVEPLDSEECEAARFNLEQQGVDLETIETDCLVRYYWQVLDRAPDSERQYQVIMDQIDDINIEVLFRNPALDENALGALERSEDWPLAIGADEAMLNAIRLQITTPQLGEITRLLRVASGEAVVRSDDEI